MLKFTFLALVFAFNSHAVVLIDNGTTEVYFKIDGKKASAVEAAMASKTDKKIERCSPKKGDFENEAGKTDHVFACKIVDLVINNKTGASKWKARN